MGNSTGAVPAVTGAMSAADRARFLEQGYLVVKQVVVPGDLERTRAAYEGLVDIQRELWAAEAGPDDPPGGAWDTEPQPRLNLTREPLDSRIPWEAAPAIDLWLGRAHEVSSALLGLDDAAVTEMMLMCNPRQDHGPAEWHRDMYPPIAAPLQGYTDDILENGPRYVQWNISLYEDDVLWVIPGSHVRLNTEEENAQLLADPLQQLPGAVQTHLDPGDGVVYILPILHWGSKYSARLRRCVHGGYSSLTSYRQPAAFENLPAASRAPWHRWAARASEAVTHTEAAFRAALAADPAAYRAALAKLTPGRGEKGERLTTVYLAKSARYLLAAKRPEAVTWYGDREPAYAADQHPTTLHWGAQMHERFGAEEAVALMQRFAPLQASLETDEPHFTPGFQGPAANHLFDRMPDLTLEQLYASWGSSEVS